MGGRKRCRPRALWLTAVLVAASIVVGGAVLRVAGGVFFGLGDPPFEDPETAAEAEEETSETASGKNRTPLSMIVPTLAFVGIALGIAPVSRIGQVTQAAAIRFVDPHAYSALVLSGMPTRHPAAAAPAEDAGITLADVVNAVGSAAGAVLLAFVALYRRRLPLLRRVPASFRLPDAIRRIQSGVVNDYVTWLVPGVACLGGALTASIR
jgi:multicomponent Na+:H+ antiporter subunit D